MTISDALDGALLVIGLAGAVGSLLGRRPFINEGQMQTLIARVGRRPIRWIAAGGYLLLGAIGAARLLGG